jgi:hypothetical protein
MKTTEKLIQKFSNWQMENPAKFIFILGFVSGVIIGSLF